MRIFVSGATGFVGGHLCRELLARGHDLRILVHSRRGAAEGVEQFQGDVTDAASCLEGAKGCDAVINLVGIIREFPGRGVTYSRLHLQGTANMVAAARENGISRYLQMSALGSRPGAASAYHRSKFAAEELLRGSGLEWTIFRPSIVFGPKDDFVNKLAGYIRSYPAVPVIGDGLYRLQPIAADDVARCFAMALEMPATVGQTYELCGPQRLTYNELLDTIGLALGRKRVVKLPNPLALMKVVVPLLDRLPFFPITRDQMTMLVEENICDGGWRQTFGFEPVGFGEGIGGYLKG